MGYIPNTSEDKREMLRALGFDSIEELLEAALPKDLIIREALDLPEPLSELEALAEASVLASVCVDSSSAISFMGAGASDHFIPSVIKHIVSRPEFETAYTPYQAEVSQGTLQAIFEFQSLVCALTGMDVANASMYDGASALAEAALLAAGHTGRRKVIVPELLHPHYLKVLKTYTHPSQIEISTAPAKGGVTDIATLARMVDNTVAAVVLQNPNFFGMVEDGNAFKEAIGNSGALLIASVDPISLGLLTPPGAYGADIVVGEGQAMGIPLGFGGPYLGFFAAREEFVRRMPGRLIGASTDDEGRRGFVMTLQTREQHIRREKATSNICTNEALCALAATVYLSVIGETGLKKIAALCFDKAHYLAEKLSKIEGITIPFGSGFFKEFLLSLPMPAADVLYEMECEGFLAGVPLSRFGFDAPNDLLVSVTEKRSISEMDAYAEALAEITIGFKER